VLGGPGTRPAPVDALAARTMVKGEPLAAPAGRADDFSWPRREVGREQSKDTPKSDSPVASASPDGTAPGTPAPPPKKRVRPNLAPPSTGFFSFGTAPAPQPQRPRATPRPPGNVGPSASAPGFFAR
jgi:hypothetical protein